MFRRSLEDHRDAGWLPRTAAGLRGGYSSENFHHSEVGGERDPTTKERLRSVAGRGGPAVE